MNYNLMTWLCRHLNCDEIRAGWEVAQNKRAIVRILQTTQMHCSVLHSAIPHRSINRQFREGHLTILLHRYRARQS